MKCVFRRLVRFKATDGSIKYGEGSDKVAVGDIVEIYHGVDPWSLEVSGETAEIGEILCPVSETSIFYGIGLNYKNHIAEAHMKEAKFPTVFTKPAGALAGPYEDIYVDEQCQFLDYEGELCVVIGKDCKNITAKDAFEDYVLGYTVGNDVSSRYWQMPEQSGNQHGYAKSFDRFGPIGPVIVSTSEIPDPKNLKLSTKVNGEQRQMASTDDLLFPIPQILEHLSRGTTLKRGTIIMTGSPSGVAAFMKPPAWLKTGDVVTVEISRIGKIENKFIIG